MDASISHSPLAWFYHYTAACVPSGIWKANVSGIKNSLVEVACMNVEQMVPNFLIMLIYHDNFLNDQVSWNIAFYDYNQKKVVFQIYSHSSQRNPNKIISETPMH